MGTSAQPCLITEEIGQARDDLVALWSIRGIERSDQHPLRVARPLVWRQPAISSVEPEEDTPLRLHRCLAPRRRGRQNWAAAQLTSGFQSSNMPRGLFFQIQACSS